jgi:hypothetical protein
MARAGLCSRKAADRNVPPRPLYPSEFGGPPTDGVVEVADQLKPDVQQVIAAPKLAPFGPWDLVRSNRHGDRLGEDAEKSVATQKMWPAAQPPRIKPGLPQQNGRHERMHRTLKKEATRPPGFNSLKRQERFDAFVREFNA